MYKKTYLGDEGNQLLNLFKKKKLLHHFTKYVKFRNRQSIQKLSFYTNMNQIPKLAFDQTKVVKIK